MFVQPFLCLLRLVAKRGPPLEEALSDRDTAASVTQLSRNSVASSFFECEQTRMSSKNRGSGKYQLGWRVTYGWALEASCKYDANLEQWRIQCEPCCDWILSCAKSLKDHAVTAKHKLRAANNNAWGQMQALAAARNTQQLADLVACPLLQTQFSCINWLLAAGRPISDQHRMQDLLLSIKHPHVSSKHWASPWPVVEARDAVAFSQKTGQIVAANCFSVSMDEATTRDQRTILRARIHHRRLGEDTHTPWPDRGENGRTASWIRTMDGSRWGEAHETSADIYRTGLLLTKDATNILLTSALALSVTEVTQCYQYVARMLPLVMFKCTGFAGDVM